MSGLCKEFLYSKELWEKPFGLTIDPPFFGQTLLIAKLMQLQQILLPINQVDPYDNPLPLFDKQFRCISPRRDIFDIVVYAIRIERAHRHNDLPLEMVPIAACKVFQNALALDLHHGCINVVREIIKIGIHPHKKHCQDYKTELLKYSKENDNREVLDLISESSI